VGYGLCQLKAASCEKVFREKITGTTADRPQLKKLMAVLTHGDAVIIPAVDRLSHDTIALRDCAKKRRLPPRLQRRHRRTATSARGLSINGVTT